MALQAADAVSVAVEEYVQAEPSLKLDVMRGGFVLRGLDGLLSAPGVPEFADALASHGVGEVHFVAPPSPEEVLSLLGIVQQHPNTLHERGGVQTALTQAGVGSIKVIAVVLSKIETPPEIPEEEADKFLAELAADAGRLAVWLRSLLASDDEGLAEGILVLANAAVDIPTFGRTMAAAFLELDTDERDRLLEVSMYLEPVEPVMVEMLSNLTNVELVAAVRGGSYGKNASTLSYALTGLPVGERADELLIETTSALRAADTEETDILFLERMVALRRSNTAEPPLAQAQEVFPSMVTAIHLAPEQVEHVRADALQHQHLDAKDTATLLRVLDASDTFAAYTSVLDALARSVPHLLEVGELDLAMSIVAEISKRSLSAAKPWPGLDTRFAQATQVTCGKRSMAALLGMPTDDGRAIEYARQLVTLGGETAALNLANSAIETEAEGGMDLAEAVLGRRLPELLAPLAPTIDDTRVRRFAELMARDGGPWCVQALRQLAARPEEKVRSDTARGIGAGGGPAISTIMPSLLRDSSESVQRVSARALGRNGSAEALSALARRLDEIESDKEIGVGREIIGLLATESSPVAETALKQAAEKGSRLRRGRNPEMRRLASEALAARRAREVK